MNISDMFYIYKQKDTVEKTNNFKTNNSPKKTYFANTQIFSARSPRKYPEKIGKLCKNVFDDERDN